MNCEIHGIVFKRTCSRCLQIKKATSNSALSNGIMADALAIYKPPFSFKAGYIYDSEGSMFADQGDEKDRAASLARIRGWGRIGGMANPEELQDTVGKHMAIALTEYWQRKAN